MFFAAHPGGSGSVIKSVAFLGTSADPVAGRAGQKYLNRFGRVWNTRFESNSFTGRLEASILHHHTHGMKMLASRRSVDEFESRN